MKQLFTLMVLATVCNAATAQSDTTKPAAASDTIRVGNIIIIKGGEKNKSWKDNDTYIRVERKGDSKPSNVSTNWVIVDFGFTNYSDKTDYANAGTYLFNRPGVPKLGASDFKLNAGKSVNVNIWLFMQRLSLIKNHVNLKYGLGVELNNYRYRSAISYLEQNPLATGQAPAPVIIRDSISFTKNKLAADYVTIPLMLNFRTNTGNCNKGFSVSVGVSAGYLYSQRNKQASEARGKQTNRGNYDLEQFKFSYIGEIGFGPVRLYGSYTPKSIYERALDMRPYTFGIRLSNW